MTICAGIVALATSGCSSQSKTVAAAFAVPPLWGDFKPIVSVKPVASRDTDSPPEEAAK